MKLNAVQGSVPAKLSELSSQQKDSMYPLLLIHMIFIAYFLFLFTPLQNIICQAYLIVENCIWINAAIQIYSFIP